MQPSRLCFGLVSISRKIKHLFCLEREKQKQIHVKKSFLILLNQQVEGFAWYIMLRYFEKKEEYLILFKSYYFTGFKKVQYLFFASVDLLIT